MSAALVMIVEKGFYVIDSVPAVPLEKQARDNGILNSHVNKVEDLNGNILWERCNENALS